jgi:ATP synthase protein I
MTDPRETKRTQDDVKPGFTSDLAARIKRAHKASTAEAAADRVRQGEMTGIGRGFRLGSEFVAAIVVGAALGWGVDRLFGTMPWGMIILLLLGFAAGVLNVIRATAELNAEAAKLPMPPSVPDDDDDE